MRNKLLREAWYIGLLDSLPLLRDPMLLIVLSLVSFLPVFFLFVFSGGNADAAMPALVGAIVLTLAFIGLFAAQSVYFYKHWFRFQDMFVASPVSPISYTLGLSLSTLFSSAPSVLIALAILVAARPVGIVAILGIFGVSAILWLAMVFAGFAIGASTKNTRRANSVPQVLGFVIGFLPPVYYPLSILPAYVQPLALLIPSTHAAQLAKHYFGLLPAPLTDVEVVFGWLYLIAFTVAMAVIVTKKARWVDP